MWVQSGAKSNLLSSTRRLGFKFMARKPKKAFRAVNAIGWITIADHLQYATHRQQLFTNYFCIQKQPQSICRQIWRKGRAGSNGIPDILDEAKWGLDWLLRMNPEKEVLYHQIADDRDHCLPSGCLRRSRRLWLRDPATGRPVYRVTDKPSGLIGKQNRSTGGFLYCRQMHRHSHWDLLFWKNTTLHLPIAFIKSSRCFAYGKNIRGWLKRLPNRPIFTKKTIGWRHGVGCHSTIWYWQNKKYLNDAAAFWKVRACFAMDICRHSPTLSMVSV